MGRQKRASPELVRDASPEPTQKPDGPPYVWALITTLAVGFLYAITLSPTTAFWDTSEYIATGHILGIPHPPGNPLFVVLARTWDVLLTPSGLTVATRINLFSALMGSLAHGLWFMAVYHILGFFSEERRFRIVGALAAVVVSATAFTVWHQSNVNEKVYTVSLFSIALLTWLAFRWRENLGKGRDDNLLVLMAFILALSVGNHLMAFLAAPALGIFVLLLSPRTLLNWRLYAVGAVAVLLGLSIHLFLPLRASGAPSRASSHGEGQAASNFRRHCRDSNTTCRHPFLGRYPFGHNTLIISSTSTGSGRVVRMGARPFSPSCDSPSRFSSPLWECTGRPNTCGGTRRRASTS